jgi:hypothetical protein
MRVGVWCHLQDRFVGEHFAHSVSLAVPTEVQSIFDVYA